MATIDETRDLAGARAEVVREVREREIKFVRLWFTDVVGRLKSFAITASSSRARWSAAWASTVPRSRASTPSRSPT